MKRKKLILGTVLPLAVALLVPSSDVRAVQIYYSSSNSYQEAAPSDGQFNDGVLKNDSTTAWWPVIGSGTGGWRTAVEFDLSALGSDTVQSSVDLLVTYDFVLGAGADLQVHGFVGDGAATRADVLINNLVATTHLPPKGSLPLVDVGFDVTQFVQSVLDSGARYAGFSFRIADDLVRNDAQNMNIWTGRISTPSGSGLGLGPRLLATAAPEPATLALLSLGLAGMALTSRRISARVSSDAGGYGIRPGSCQ